ncbi:MAG: hypothetical protein ACREDL_11845 [Bradyrhizobium sp.]
MQHGHEIGGDLIQTGSRRGFKGALVDGSRPVDVAFVMMTLSDPKLSRHLKFGIFGRGNGGG